MLRIDNNQNIYLTRGDTARFSIDIINDVTKSPYSLSSRDTLRLTVRKQEFSDVEFQKVVSGTSSFNINPSDTNSMSFGEYLYDVELTTSSGEVYTIIEPSIFRIMKEVTY